MRVLLALELVLLMGVLVYGWRRPERRRTRVERWMKRRWRRWRRRHGSGSSRGPLPELAVVLSEPALARDERQPAATRPLRDLRPTDPQELGGHAGGHPHVLAVRRVPGAGPSTTRPSHPAALAPSSGPEASSSPGDDLVMVEGAQDTELTA